VIFFGTNLSICRIINFYSNIKFRMISAILLVTTTRILYPMLTTLVTSKKIYF